MNPERLLAHFDRISEAPDAIPRLRQFILDLAIRGKLTKQYPDDESACALLERIKVEKAHVLNGGRPPKISDCVPPSCSAFPFELPVGWFPANLQSLCISVTDGDHLPPPKSDRGIPFLVIGNVRNQVVEFTDCRHVSEDYYKALDSSRQPQKGDLLYTLVGSLGIPIMVTDERPFCVQRHIAILRPAHALNVRYLYRVLESKWVLDQAWKCATGIAQKTVPLAGLRSISIPLAPLAEQHRIVAKVDELMALCDRLEAAKTEREKRQDQLVAASLQRLNQPADAPEFLEHGHFHLRHLPRLTTRPEHIQQLRQTILNLAVRGKIVAQNSDDEPAASMLGNRQILEHQRDGRLLPKGWVWSSFSNVGQVFGGGTPSKANPDFWSGTIPWVSPKDMKVSLVSEAQDHITEQAIANSSASLIPAGALLMVVRGMILAHSFPTALTGVPLAINQDMKAIIPFRSDIAPMLLLITQGMKTDVLRLVQHSTHGTCRLPTGDLFSMPIPIPPLAEQGRIIQRVRELMIICDRLEAQLRKSQSETCRLLEAHVHEVLAPERRMMLSR